MLLDWLNRPEQARIVREAVEKSVLDGIMTSDLGGKASTLELTDSIVSHIVSTF
jgi:methanogen homoisocitrate dehydrogenase